MGGGRLVEAGMGGFCLENFCLVSLGDVLDSGLISIGAL